MKDRIPEQVTWKILKSGTVLLNLKTGDYYTLNETASEIWNLVLEDKKKDEIISAVCDIYDISKEQAGQDVSKTFSFLESESLLKRKDNIE
ncbi:MAG: PqqD family protein [bacterium]|nr:PqqD family protein [bacterium]